MKTEKIKRRNSFISKGKYEANMRIDKNASSAKYRMDKQFQNSLIFEISSFLNWKNSENLLVFQVVKFWKFYNFPISKIPKISQFPKTAIINQLKKFMNFSNSNNLENQEIFLILPFGK